MKVHELETRPQAAPHLLRQVEEEEEKEPEAQGLISRQYDPLAQLSTRTAGEPRGDAQSATLRRSVAGRPLGLPDSMLSLQRTYGNRYTQGLIARAAQGNEETEVAPEVEEAIQRARGGGQALDSGARSQMEPAFGVDFTGVRVHTGTEADALSRVLDARAFAIGKDVFFRDGEYNSENTGGRELLAHELTHVVQDSGVHCKLVVSAPDDETEQVAERVSKQVMRKPESESWTSTTDRREFKPNDFQSTCRKNNDGLHRYPKEEGLVVSGSIGSIEDYRKTKQVINDRIRTWTELGVGDLRDGIQEGVGSFERWHKARRKKPNAASFVMTLAQSLVGIIGVAVGAAVPGAIVPVVTALITGVTREARRCLAQEYNPNADPEEEVRKLAQNATSFSSWIDRYYDGWGAKLEEHAPAVWDEIQEYVVAEEIDQALEILHSQGGVPRMNEPYANDILNRLISDYLVWELKWNLDWERYTLPGMELSKQALEDIANEATLETRSQLRFREK